MRQPFEFELIGDETPMNKDNFYHWLMKDKNLKVKNPMLDYLEELGFDLEIHIVKFSSLETLKFILDAAQRAWMPSTEVYKFEDLFTRTSDPASDYSNQNHFNPVFKINGVTFLASSKLLRFIEEQGCIYPINSFNIRFKTITPNDGDTTYLYYDYQYIIGGRKLCKISESFE